jgi:hypothetical protein
MPYHSHPSTTPYKKLYVYNFISADYKGQYLYSKLDGKLAILTSMPPSLKDNYKHKRNFDLFFGLPC